MKGGISSKGQWFARKDPKLKYLQRSRPANFSIFEFLADGCFETDWQSYCVSPVNGYSCSYWLASEDLVTIPWQRTNELNDTKNGELMNDCLARVSGIKSLPLQFIVNLLLIMVIIVVFIVNITTVLTMRRLGMVYLPICHYFTYICFFELFDFFILSADWLIGTFTRLQPLLMFQLMSPSSCQMIHMVFSTCRHIIPAMVIGMAIDLWRFVHGSVYFLANYRSEWVKNVFILCMVIVCTINCQFFWTFDLNQGENKVIHGRILSNYMECDFSNTLPLNQIFTKYLWPLADHFLGEVLPIITCLFSASVSMVVIKRKFSLKYPINLSKILINAPFVLQLTKSLIGFLLLSVVTNFLPRIIYVGIKVILQTSVSQPARGKTGGSNFLDMHQYLNYKTNSNDDFDQSFLGGYGRFIKYQLPFNILIRFIYFSILLKEFRHISIGFLAVFKRIIPRRRMATESNTAERLVTNSSLDKELMFIEDSKNEDSKRKSILVEIYC